MKVLHVVPSLSTLSGGVASSVRDLCRGLAQAGVSVHLATTPRGRDADREGPLDEHLRQSGVRVDYYPVHSWSWLGERYAWSPALGKALESLVQASDIVHLHSLWLYPTQAAARTCRKHHIPYVISPCGALDPYGLASRPFFKWPYGLLMERPSLSGASALHFTSEMERSHAFLFWAQPPAAVIPCSIPIDEIPAVAPGAFRRRFPEAREPRLLLFMGRLHAKKRLDIAVETFIRIARKRPDVRLIVAGRDEGAVPGARSALLRSGMAERATFCGFLAGREKWEALADSSLFLLPSEDENFGIAALEASAAGRPVILSKGVAYASTAVQGGAGLCVESSPESWACAIESLLKNPKKMEAMGEAGKHLARDQFSTARVAAAMRDLYQKILSGGMVR